MSSISCNESTPHTSSISPTEICLLVAMVLTGVSLIVRASNPYYFTARLFSISFRLSEEVRTEDPRSTDHPRKRTDPGCSSVPGPCGISKGQDNRNRPARDQNKPLWRVQLPGEEEARYWLQQWPEGAKPQQETPVRRIVIRRNRTEVRE